MGTVLGSFRDDLGLETLGTTFMQGATLMAVAIFLVQPNV
jgi:hypothetical protein